MIKHNKRCLHCKELFVSKRSDTKYCSDSCRVLAYFYRQKTYWQKELEERNKYNEEQARRFEYIVRSRSEDGNKNKEQNISSEQAQNITAPEIPVKAWDPFENIKAELEKIKKESAKRDLEYAKRAVYSDISRICKKNIDYHNQGRISERTIKSIIQNIKSILNSYDSKKMAENFLPLVFLKDKFLPFCEPLLTKARRADGIFIDFEIPEDMLEELENIYEQVSLVD